MPNLRRTEMAEIELLDNTERFRSLKIVTSRKEIWLEYEVYSEGECIPWRTVFSAETGNQMREEPL